MLENKVNKEEKEKITRRNFLDGVIELLAGAVMAVPIIYYFETKAKQKRELMKEKLISRGYSPAAVEEIVTGKRFYMNNMPSKEEYYERFGDRVIFSYEEWLKKWDESCRKALGKGLFKDKFGEFYIKDIKKDQEYK